MLDFMLPGSNAFYHKKVKHFLDHGGKVMWALEAVVGEAEDDEDRTGEDEHFPILSCATLPEHPDDNDFSLVRRQLGYSLLDESDQRSSEAS